jgi:ABC-2 type transport system ATP-binding protein
MDEAQRLCDRIAVIDHGRVLTTGTSAGPAAEAGLAKEVRFAPSAPVCDHVLTDLPEVQSVKADDGEAVVTGHGDLVNAVILTLAARGVTAHDVRTETPSLEDAFVRLTSA